jgi:D-xylono/L-arabinono-1,4-lactonase
MILDGVGCSNGMAFTPDQTVSFTQIYSRSTFIGSTLTKQPANFATRQSFTRFLRVLGFPDRRTAGSEGHLWFTLWGGSAIARLDPKGSVEELSRSWQRRSRDLHLAVKISGKSVTREGGLCPNGW